MLDRQASVEGLVHSADALVLEPEMQAVHIDAQILAYDLVQSRQERFLLLFFFFQFGFSISSPSILLLLHLFLLLFFELLQ